jgi:hypothetical protein
LSLGLDSRSQSPSGTLVAAHLGRDPIAGNRRREQQQRRPMPAIQDLDLSRVLVCSSHFAISNGKTIGAEGFVCAGELFLSHGIRIADEP